jgi:hypothetical protein
MPRSEGGKGDRPLFPRNTASAAIAEMDILVDPVRLSRLEPTVLGGS